MKRRRRDPSGSATVELVLVTPVLMVLALFVVLSGRSGEALRQVQHAADHGARAASQVSAVKRVAVGSTAAAKDLDSAGTACIDPLIRVESTKVGRLEAVRVSVSCGIDHSGLTLLGMSPRRVAAESVEVIDVYRAK